MMNLNLLRGPGNVSLDIARLIAASAGVTYPMPFVYNVIAHGQVPDPASFGTGYAAVLVAIGGMICAKDIGVAKANASANNAGA